MPYLDKAGLTHLWGKIKELLGNKVDKVSGKSLSTNDFTDTEQSKLDATNVAYGTCTTAAATAAKVVTISGNTNWKLAAGSIIVIKFSYTNTAESPTFNVNSTGAKPVLYGTAVITTSSLSYAGYASRYGIYAYDGTRYVFVGWSYDANSTYSNASLGQGYGTCATAAATTAKVVTLSSYSLTKGGVVSVKFTYAVPASATMNINSKGAKAIFYRGAAITAGIIDAGDVATFLYDGTQYHLLTVDRHRFFSLLVPYGTAIPEDANLNTATYMRVGNYYCSSNATAKTLTNCPTTSAFMLTVYSPLSTTIDNETTKTWIYRLRKLQVYTGDEYVQYCYVGDTAGTWTYGPWKKVIKSDDVATTSAAGLMSAADKTKLNGIAEGANKYTLPKANSSTLGGVKIALGASDAEAMGLMPVVENAVDGCLYSEIGVSSVTTGTANGTISVNTNGTSANVAVKGLGSNAYTSTSYLPTAGGNISGHVYLTGAKESSSTGNTSQLVFGTSSSNHLAISSNNNALVLNPTTSSTTNQIVLYLDKQSQFPGGLRWSDVKDKTNATTSAAGLMSAADKAKLDSLSNGGDTVPSYWQTHLDTRVSEIRAAMAAAGFNKSAFLWYSDSHFSYNYKQSPMLLKYLHKHTNINKTIFGGDIVDTESANASDMSYLWEWRDAIRDLPNHHSVPGNHDDGNTVDNRWDDAYIYAFLQAAEETPDVVRGNAGLYYYIDVPTEKTRYLYLDTATADGNINNDTVEQQWLKDTLVSTPGGWHIVAAAHIWRTYDSNYADTGWSYGGKYCLDQFDAYNARTGIYASCTGKVELCIGGHTHVDADHYSTGGIPVILTECDGRSVRSGLSCTSGTISEASVNAIVVDYTAGVVNVIRVGRGSSRVVSLTGGGSSGGDTPDIPSGDYTNVLTAAGYKENTRYSSSSQAETTQSGWDLTGYIPIKKGDVVRFANVNFLDLDGTGGTSRAMIYLFDSSKAYITCSSAYSPTSLMSSAWSAVYGDNGDVVQFTLPTSYSSSTAYIRIGARNIDQYSVITVNETID